MTARAAILWRQDTPKEQQRPGAALPIFVYVADDEEHAVYTFSPGPADTPQITPEIVATFLPGPELAKGVDDSDLSAMLTWATENFCHPITATPDFPDLLSALQYLDPYLRDTTDTTSPAPTGSAQ